ncbi:MAG: glycosyltransferase family 4 protein [Pirellula sp.]
MSTPTQPHLPSVCFVNRCYWPDSEATGQLLTELCEYLAPRWSVSAVVGQPNWDVEDTTYSRSGVQIRNGVAIHRLLHSQLSKTAEFARIRNLISFTLAFRRWSKKVGNSVFANSNPVYSQSISPKRPTIVCETDPFLLPLVVGGMARKCNANLVYYLQDIYPDVAIAVGVAKNSMAMRFLRKRLKNAYLKANKIVVLDEDMRDRLVDWGIPSDRLCIVPNWMDCSVVKPARDSNAFRVQHGMDDSFVIMHSGNMGMTQRLDVLIDAIKRPNIPRNSLLALVGNGANRPRLEKQANGAVNVRFFDYQPRDQLSNSLSAADLHVVSMDKSITGCLAPSKLYGILASGTPVLAIVPKGSAVWRLVDAHQLGWTVEPGNDLGIADAISEASKIDRQGLRAIGDRGRELAVRLFDKSICCQQFEDVLKQV